jgi:hypothetical protein
MKTHTLIAVIAFALCACGGSSSNSTSGANVKNSNASNGVSQTNKDKEPAADMTPLTMDISEFMGSYDASKEGRRVTVKGGQLDAISYSTLTIRSNSGYAFSCNGSFSDYMNMAPKIDSLRQSHRSPEVVVEGKYSRSSYDNNAALSSCILLDLKK